MEILGEALFTTILWVFGVLILAIVIGLAAVWFGLFVVAPRIQRALDRTEIKEEEPGDRDD